MDSKRNPHPATAIIGGLSYLCCLLLIGSVHSQVRERPTCEWCGADEAPAELDWKATIAAENEPGERLIVQGTVFERDGSTPASGVLLYLYHTNADGIYPTRGDETGNGVRHGYLRTWVMTGDDGRYRVFTIKPEPYPNRAEPAHIHITVKGPDKPESWIDSIMFSDDPLLSASVRERLPNRGGPGIVTLTRSEDGTLVAERDIVYDE